MSSRQIARRQISRRLSRFARRLLSEWKSLGLPRRNQRVVVAVSGGADSTALFVALAELLQEKKLELTLTVAHLDHRLRKNSKADAAWVSQLAEHYGYPAVTGRISVRSRARKTTDNLEQAARRARYEFLERTAIKVGSRLILTAHTLDDQAETVLMRLLRGSAAEGLGGAEAVRPIASDSEIQLARPLLSWARHTDSQDYCRSRRIDFRLDEMNEDERFTRVKIRKQLLPLMESFNNRLVEALGRTANLLREDALALSQQASELLLAASKGSFENGDTNLPSLNVKVLASAPAAIRRRALRQWISSGRGHLRGVEMVHLLGVERLLEGNRGGRVAELPGGARVARRGGRLELVKKG